MATTKKKIDFKIENATIDDLPVMQRIGDDAFRDDIHTNLKTFNLPPQESGNGSHMTDWFGLPNATVLKAVSTADNTILGWVCWANRGYFPRPVQPEKTAGRFSEETDPEALKKTKVQELEDIEEAHFVQFMTDIMPPGTKCWYMGGCNVDPKYQGMGVGKALISFGTGKAEEDGVFAWVHSSEMSFKAYEACGFEIVRTLPVDLDAYAEGPAVGKGPGPDGKWGIFINRYMVYKPERAPITKETSDN